MATYGCSPRAHWFADLTDSERMRMTACAPNPVFVSIVDAPSTALPHVHRLSDADVDRIARRVVELLREAKL